MYPGVLVILAAALSQYLAVAKVPPSGLCHYCGDPHYTTFDNLWFDYQGICKYNLASYCGRNGLLKPFRVLAKNEYRYGITWVSWPQYVEVWFAGDVVRLGSSIAAAEVNGFLTPLPIFTPNYSVTQSSGYAVYSAPGIGLNVAFDGAWSVYVSVSSSYAKYLCGLCGNFDGVTTNDWLMSNGMLATSGTQLGDSWIVPDPQSTNDRCPRKRRKRQADAYPPPDPASVEICKTLIDVNGVLGPLVTAVGEAAAQRNYDDCLMDAGYSKGESAKYSVRHFAVAGNAAYADCPDCQVDVQKALASYF